jgi:hypothetical protein
MLNDAASVWNPEMNYAFLFADRRMFVNCATLKCLMDMTASKSVIRFVQVMSHMTGVKK